MSQNPGGSILRSWRMRFLIGAGFFLGFGLWWWSAYAADIESLEKLVRRRFPSVRQISTEELARWIESRRPAPLLLDLRDADEYAVSHLSGARHVAPDAKAQDVRLGVPKDAPIVTYCSVGYRSSAFARRLQDAGYTNVQNLEGSIFRWANEGRPLVRDGRPVQVVHPYSNYWSRLLKPERRAGLPRH